MGFGLSNTLLLPPTPPLLPTPLLPEEELTTPTAVPMGRPTMPPREGLLACGSEPPLPLVGAVALVVVRPPPSPLLPRLTAPPRPILPAGPPALRRPSGIRRAHRWPPPLRNPPNISISNRPPTPLPLASPPMAAGRWSPFPLRLRRSAPSTRCLSSHPPALCWRSAGRAIATPPRRALARVPTADPAAPPERAVPAPLHVPHRLRVAAVGQLALGPVAPRLLSTEALQNQPQLRPPSTRVPAVEATAGSAEASTPRRLRLL